MASIFRRIFAAAERIIMNKHQKKIIAMCVMLFMLVPLGACAGMQSAGSVSTQSGEDSVIESAAARSAASAGETAEGATAVELQDNATREAAGVSVDGNVITITKAGSYTFSGTLSEGRLVVDAADEDVTLILNGVDIRSGAGAPLMIDQAKKMVLVLQNGSANILTDSNNDDSETEGGEPAAALFSKTNLVIDGGGSLTVNTYHGVGIRGKDGLDITGGTMTINAADDGIVGNNMTVSGGKIAVTAQSDAIVSTNGDGGTGDVIVTGGAMILYAQGDGIQCAGTVRISGGDLQITSGAGSANSTAYQEEPLSGVGGEENSGTDASDNGVVSSKGLKSTLGIFISGGAIFVDAEDDAIYSDGSIVVSGGKFALSSTGNGIHAKEQMTIEECEQMEISTSYMGLEAYNISISGGDISVVASDDGINIMGQDQDTETDNGGVLTVSGGNIHINAGGAGLDSGGSIAIRGGTVVVDGSESAGNSALDYKGTCIIDGGTVIAAGSATKTEMASEDSKQNVIVMTLDSAAPIGSEIQLTDSNGRAMLSYTVSKSLQSILFSTAQITANQTYNIIIDGVDALTFTADEGSTYVTSNAVMTGA